MNPDDTSPLAATLQRVLDGVRERPAVPEADAAAATISERIAERRAEWDRRIPARFRAAELDDVDLDAAEQIEAWCGDPAGNLLLFGPVGVGKTYAAVGALRHRHWLGDSVRFYAVAQLLELLRPGGDEQAMNRAVHSDVVLLDDLGAERATEWTYERLYLVVNSRWLSGKPTIVTTNAPDGDALCAAAGERIYSRLVDGSSVMLQLRGPDRRRQ